MENQGFKYYFKNSFKSSVSLPFTLPSSAKKLFDDGREIYGFENDELKRSKAKPSLESIAIQTGFVNHALGMRKRVGQILGFQTGFAIGFASTLTLAEVSKDYTHSYIPLVATLAVTNYLSIVKEFNNYRNRRSQTPQN